MTEASAPAAAPSAVSRTAFPKWLVACRRDVWRLEILDLQGVGLGEAGQELAERGPVTVFFDGVLFNHTELERELGEALPARSTAGVVLAAYERWGDDAVERLRGMFALVVCDTGRRRFLAARDPVGMYPLYWAAAGATLFFSTSPERLVAEQSVSSEVNRPALADLLRHNFPDTEETYFAAVKKVPPGHRLHASESGATSERYWDPGPPGTPIEWVDVDELDRFDELLDQAVDRCLSLGPTAILLSGGLDSVSVAAVATDQARRNGGSPPLALSLGFPHPESNEEPIQRAVAAELGLEHVLRGFDEIVGPRGLLLSALDLARHWPQPLFNAWLPAYRPLVEDGMRRGCRVILTGTGGDEWLSVTPYYAADLMRALDIAGLVRLWRTFGRSYRHSRGALAKTVLWSFGLRPLLGSFVNAAAPAVMSRRRARFPGRTTPGWVAPDGALRRELDARAERAPQLSDVDGLYMREVRRGLEHPLIGLEYEERFENGRSLGVREVHPLLDADLVDFLWRVPPEHLDRGGRSKGLVRETLARRFPELGFERHRKVNATSFFRNILLSSAEAARGELGGVPALSELGIVDARAWQATYDRIRAHDHREAYRIWEVFSVEAWVQENA